MRNALETKRPYAGAIELAAATGRFIAHVCQSICPDRRRPREDHGMSNGLSNVEGISEVHQVMGPYDIVAVVDVENLSEVPAVISRHIRAVEGIESTTTCVTFPEGK